MHVWVYVCMYVRVCLWGHVCVCAYMHACRFVCELSGAKNRTRYFLPLTNWPVPEINGVRFLSTDVCAYLRMVSGLRKRKKRTNFPCPLFVHRKHVHDVRALRNVLFEWTQSATHCASYRVLMFGPIFSTRTDTLSDVQKVGPNIVQWFIEDNEHKSRLRFGSRWDLLWLQNKGFLQRDPKQISDKMHCEVGKD